MRKIKMTVAMLANFAVAALNLPSAVPAATPIPLGLYVGNPNGSDNAALGRFQSDWDASVRQLQQQPQLFGTFTDFGQDWSGWGSNAGWTAGSFNSSGRGAGLKPVIGIKLSTNAYWGH